MRFILVLFLVSSLTILRSFGQSDFKPGYIITHSLDTIYGEIDHRGPTWMSKNCVFRMNDKTTQYAPQEIFGYRLEEDIFYVSKEVGASFYFLEYLINGKVNIYYKSDTKSGSYYVEKEDMELSEIPYSEKVIKLKESPNDIEATKSYLAKSTQHVGILKYYMQDAPALSSRIEDFGEPTHQNLIKLAKNYHYSVCDDQECVVYEKPRSFNMGYEVAGGLHRFSYAEFGNNYGHGGVILHVNSQKRWKNIFLKTGLIIVSSPETETFDGPELRIPLLFEYIYPKYIVRPKIGYGINIYNPFTHTVAISAGFNVKVSDRLFISTNYDIDFIPSETFPLLVESVFTNGVSLGLIFGLN